MATTSATNSRETMNRKPVLLRDAKTVLNMESEQFREKLLCDGIVFNLGDACAYSCTFCYVGTSQRYHAPPVINAYNSVHGTGLHFQDVVIRRKDAIELLERQLLKKDGSSRYQDPADRRVAFSSTLVDVAANMDLLRETADACNLILDNTAWDIRLLSKSGLLHKLVADRLIPEKHHHRLIFGFSTGTLDDRVAAAIEQGTSKVSKRIESLHWLQDRGFRTFGMICPSLPQEDYDRFSREICQAVRADLCEHVWAEVINLRGKSFTRTMDALTWAGLYDEADRLHEVSAPGSAERWEDYARQTFLSHAKHIPADKLRFLQYVTPCTAHWWSALESEGAVCLGKSAIPAELPAPTGTSAGRETQTTPSCLTQDEKQYLDEREKIVELGLRTTIATAKALFEIHGYEGGRLWRIDHPTFESYCRKRWDIGKSQAYRLLECGNFISVLEQADTSNQSPFGDRLPKNEGQLRPLLALPEEHRVECWKEIVAHATPSELTAREVGGKVRQYAAERELPGLAGEKRPTGLAVTSAKHLGKLRKISSGHVNHTKISALLDEIETLLK